MTRLVIDELHSKNFEVVAGFLAEEPTEKFSETVEIGRRFRPEDFGQVPEYFADHGVDKLVMAGSVDRTVLYDDERLEEADGTVSSALEQVEANRDENLIETAVEVLESFGITVQGIDTVLENYLAPSGHKGGPPPGENDLRTLDEISTVAVNLADLEVGQTVLGKNQSVVAVEAAEGTNKTIRRAGDLAGDGLIMVKVARTSQDFRLDVPVVGSSTVSELVQVDASMLAFEAGRMLWVQREECRELAGDNNLTLLGWERES